MKIVLITAGTISLGFGIIGIFLPVLPTTPFLLLTAGLYLRSSDKLYNAVINSRLAGDYIKKYQTNKGMSIRSKVISILLMWIMISISAFWCVKNVKMQLLLIILGVIGTVVMGVVVPTSKKNKNM
ncbi:MAG: YbaN family protein [Bacteroidales bacterium]|nr:YbaN family protein [Bacteroidales bacterium]